MMKWRMGGLFTRAAGGRRGGRRRMTAAVAVMLWAGVGQGGAQTVAPPVAAEAEADGRPWQTLWQELLESDDADEALAEENLELLDHLAENKIDLNRATRDELERLPFLSAVQVMDIADFADRYRPLRSLAELQMVASLGQGELRMLAYFVTVEPMESAKIGDSIARGGRSLRQRRPPEQHALTLTARVPLYERRGYRNGYLGYGVAHEVSYDARLSPRVRLVLGGAQDAGEPFLAGGNKWGYDAYNFALELDGLGGVESLIVGRYKLSSGMGLVVNNGFSVGKLSMLQRLGRPEASLRANTSRSEAYSLSGAAARLRLAEGLTLTPFVSLRPLDATLTADGDARTLVTSGYHRTPSEMDRKHNTWQTDLGFCLNLRRRRWHVGATLLYSRLDRRLSPDTTAWFRHFSASGRRFVNAGLNYGLTLGRLSLSGETAANQDGRLALIHAACLTLGCRLSAIVLHRQYSYRYTSLHARSFGENTEVTNECGLYLGARWRGPGGLSLRAYADWAHFPMARYRASAPSSAADVLAEASYQPRPRLALTARYRLHLRQQDDAGGNRLLTTREHRLRLLAAGSVGRSWQLHTQLDAVQAETAATERGLLLGQRADWRRRGLQVGLGAAVFSAPSWAARLYFYDRQLPRIHAFPAYYGRGFHLSALLLARLGRQWQAGGRLSLTRYLDRRSVGSGLQAVDHSYLTDVELSLRRAIRH